MHEIISETMRRISRGIWVILLPTNEDRGEDSRVWNDKAERRLSHSSWDTSAYQRRLSTRRLSASFICHRRNTIVVVVGGGRIDRSGSKSRSQPHASRSVKRDRRIFKWYLKRRNRRSLSFDSLGKARSSPLARTRALHHLGKVLQTRVCSIEERLIERRSRLRDT